MIFRSLEQGVDLIKLMVESAKPSNSDIQQEAEAELVQNPIPQLPSAAFLPPKRERSSTWNSVSSVEQAKPFKSPVRIEDASKLEKGEVSNSFSNANFNNSLASPVEVQKLDVEDLSKASDVNSTKLSEISDEDILLQADNSIHLTSLATKSDETLIQPDLPFDVMLGVQNHSPQYGILGEVSGRKVALDLTQTHTIGLFGVQGAGKSYTLGTIIEMACTTIANINVLPSPLATVVFHYSPTSDYKPEFTSMMHPNSEADQMMVLRDHYNADPTALRDILILVPKSKVEERKAEYPGIKVLPIAFASSELKASHWKFLMGAVGSQSMYLRQINLIMRP